MVGWPCNFPYDFSHHLCDTNTTMKKIFLPFFLVAAIGASAQKVSNKINFQKGQTLEVVTNMNMTTQSMMGEMPANIIITDQYAVGEVAADQIQLTKTPKRMKLSMSMMGQDMNIDSDNPKDLEGQFGGPIKELMKQKQEFTVDATGLVTAVKADEKKKKTSEQAGMMGMMMPGLSNGAIATAGQPSIFKILPSREVAKGDTWTDSVTTEGNKSITVYTVKDITETEILLDYNGTAKTKTTQSAMGMSADVAADITSSGAITLDKATGLMKQKTLTSTTETNMNMNGNQMSSTTKTTAVTTVKAN